MEKLPIFTLGENSRPTQKEVSTLCSCIWNEFPEGGWEQRTSIKIRDGIDPGWRGKGLISRFDQHQGCPQKAQNHFHHQSPLLLYYS